MRYSLLPLALATSALATPLAPRKECAADADSYDFVCFTPPPPTHVCDSANIIRSSSEVVLPAWL